MDAVILAGGRGSRLGSLTKSTPKPMIKIGGKPILWHILKILDAYGIKNFIICLGYKGDVIKKYLKTIKRKDWKINCVNTGKDTLTGRRIYLVKDKIKSENFLMTYGDGLANINIKKLIKTHYKKKKLVTVTAVNPIPRFGSLYIKNEIVTKFDEKIIEPNNLINGGFFIIKKKIFRSINLSKNVMWEQYPMIELTKKKQLSAYYHKSFWHPMDTERDFKFLNKLFNKGAPWKIW